MSVIPAPWRVKFSSQEVAEKLSDKPFFIWKRKIAKKVNIPWQGVDFNLVFFVRILKIRIRVVVDLKQREPNRIQASFPA